MKQIQTNLLYILTKIKSEKSTFVFKSLENKNHADKNYYQIKLSTGQPPVLIQWRASQWITKLLCIIRKIFDVLKLFNVKITIKTKYQMSIDYSTSFWVNYSEQTFLKHDK